MFNNTDAGQPNNEQTVKIELLSQWKLEAEFRNMINWQHGNMATGIFYSRGVFNAIKIHKNGFAGKIISNMQRAAETPVLVSVKFKKFLHLICLSSQQGLGQAVTCCINKDDESLQCIDENMGDDFSPLFARFW